MIAVLHKLSNHKTPPHLHFGKKKITASIIQFSTTGLALTKHHSNPCMSVYCTCILKTLHPFDPEIKFNLVHGLKWPITNNDGATVLKIEMEKAP